MFDDDFRLSAERPGVTDAPISPRDGALCHDPKVWELKRNKEKYFTHTQTDSQSLLNVMTVTHMNMN